MNEIFKLIGDLGFPIAVALAGGYFVYLTIKLLLQGVLGSIKGMAGIITAFRDVLLDGRMPGDYLLTAALVSGVILVTGYLLFKRVEFKFADIV